MGQVEVARVEVMPVAQAAGGQAEVAVLVQAMAVVVQEAVVLVQVAVVPVAAPPAEVGPRELVQQERRPQCWTQASAQ